MKVKLLIIYFLLSCFFIKGQIANYINNGGFEQVVPGYNPPLAKYWGAIDTMKFYGFLLTKSLPPFNVPQSSWAYQWPKHGDNYFITNLLYNSGGIKTRGYPKNPLKKKLETGVTYCVKFYYSVTNNSTHGIDGLGVYFGDISIDTITHCTVPLTYLVPQVQNPTGSIITDTLNWVPITGTFVADGTEKYMILGNFKSESAMDTILINPTYLPDIFCDILIDDVSCIDIDLPAFAGNDNSVIPGDSIFLGREPDVGIDEACMWYKLPTVITPTTPAIDTVAGFWIKPVTTVTYVVRQQLWCSSVKWDTVVIYMNPVGLEKLKLVNEELKIYPVPANDFIELKISNKELWDDFNSIALYNNLGQLIKEEEISFKEEKIVINTNDFKDGVYALKIKSNNSGTVSKRFVISR